jgi:phage terminase large subunit-like protein
MYERGIVHHAGAFPALEDEMYSLIQEDHSPDRMDALAWAVTELRLKKRTADPRMRMV